MKRHVVLIALILVLARTAITPAQQEIKDFFQGLEDKADRIRKWEREEQQKIAQEMRAESERLRPFWLMLEAEQLQGENQFLPAIERTKEAARKYEGKRAEQLTFAGAAAYREILLQLGRLYALIGEQEQARQAALQAWKIHEVVMASSRRGRRADQQDRMRTALAVALVLVAADQPDEAAVFVHRAFDVGRQMPEPFNRPEQNPFLVEALLLKSMLANNAGNYPAALVAGKELERLLRRQYPCTTHPDGDPKLAAGLANLASAHVALGEFLPALSLLDEADRILGQHDPKGKPIRAEVKRILGHLYLHRGEDKQAQDNITKARLMYEELFPEKSYPRSHPALIQALASLADLLNHYHHRETLDYAKLAWQHCQRRYAQQSHSQKVSVLLTYGRCLRDAGQLESARRRFAEAVDMASVLGAAKPTAGGDSLTALCQLHLGSLLGRQGRYDEARKLFQSAQATYQKFFPDGHPHLFAIAGYQGVLASRQGDRAGARAAFARALQLDQKQLRHFARTVAEVEVLSFTQPRQLVLHGYLSASRGEPELDEQAFRWVWASKNAVTRLAQARRAAVRLAGDRGNPEAKRILAELVDTCARLRQGQTTVHAGTSLPTLVKEMNRLELELSQFWPEAERLLHEAENDPGDLAAHLPSGSAFIDFVRYTDLAEGQAFQPRYVAFVALPGRKPRRIELELAQPIDETVNAWRKSVDGWNPRMPDAARRDYEQESETLAAKLRRIVWERIAPVLPAETRLLILAPDGDLARFPFAALPGDQARTILLQKFSIAYVPHGQFLLAHLHQDKARPRQSDSFLAVGGVAYGTPGALPDRAFKDLPGSLGVIELAKRWPTTQTTHILRDREATVNRLLGKLPEVSEAHLSTHGFFDEKALNEEREQQTRMIRDWTPRLETPVGYIGLGHRFPLSFVGLVLAGANEPNTADGGILTGETLSHLSLPRSRLIVLDACETGLGKYTAGEGVQGLQRAVHLVGCPNVIATLWRVNDAASQALAEEFYRQLWQNKLPTLEALRQAQLALYRDPGRVSQSGQRRGIPQREPFPDPEIRLPSSIHPNDRSHTQMWGAAYVHSGMGDPLLDPAELSALVGRLEEQETPETATASSFGVLPALALGGLLTLAVFVVMLIWRLWCKPAVVVAAPKEPEAISDSGSEQ
ncbi:MAG TPA: CHAT domain-containing protein [Gemmataceae bacterium]|nr:CHAT domain-containing protein [Gemmataceae bacterium]